MLADRLADPAGSEPLRRRGLAERGGSALAAVSPGIEARAVLQLPCLVVSDEDAEATDVTLQLQTSLQDAPRGSSSQTATTSCYVFVQLLSNIE